MNKDQTFRFKLSEEISKRLEKEKERTGAPIAEVIRRAINFYLTHQEMTNSNESN